MFETNEQTHALRHGFLRGVGMLEEVWKDLYLSPLLHHTPTIATSVHWLFAALPSFVCS